MHPLFLNFDFSFRGLFHFMQDFYVKVFILLAIVLLLLRTKSLSISMQEITNKPDFHLFSVTPVVVLGVDYWARALSKQNK